MSLDKVIEEFENKLHIDKPNENKELEFSKVLLAMAYHYYKEGKKDEQPTKQL